MKNTSLHYLQTTSRCDTIKPSFDIQQLLDSSKHVQIQNHHYVVSNAKSYEHFSTSNQTLFRGYSTKGEVAFCFRVLNMRFILYFNSMKPHK